MTDGEKIVHHIGMLISAERAVVGGAQFDILTNARKMTAAAIDEVLNSAAEKEKKA